MCGVVYFVVTEFLSSLRVPVISQLGDAVCLRSWIFFCGEQSFDMFVTVCRGPV